MESIHIWWSGLPIVWRVLTFPLFMLCALFEAIIDTVLWRSR